MTHRIGISIPSSACWQANHDAVWHASSCIWWYSSVLPPMSVVHQCNWSTCAKTSAHNYGNYIASESAGLAEWVAAAKAEKGPQLSSLTTCLQVLADGGGLFVFLVLPSWVMLLMTVKLNNSHVLGVSESIAGSMTQPHLCDHLEPWPRNHCTDDGEWKKAKRKVQLLIITFK